MRTLVHLTAAFVVLVMDWLTGASRSEPLPHAPLVRFTAKHPWMTGAVVMTALGLGTTMLVVSGVVPVRASSGHWPLTAWLLDFAKLQSVRTYSRGIEPPDLQDEGLVTRGAAHYAIGCEPCHGSPDDSVPPVMAAMTPPPPELTGERLTRWTSAQLFSIVKHGIKFTGMPAWPVQQRDDEVWAVVAFVSRLPRTDADEYRRLAGRDTAIQQAPAPVPTSGQAELPGAVREICSRCHGVDGRGRNDAFPNLAAQREDYLHAALRAFANRSRFSATMSQVATRLSDGEMRQAASYYGQLPARSRAALDSAAGLRGAMIATRGAAERNIPACVECHGPAETPKNPAYPRLAGQHFWYLRLQLDLLQQRRRGGSPSVNLMHEVVDHLTVSDMEDVARYFATLDN